MMDPNDIEHRITSNTKAIMPVHINGRVCNMDMISKIAKENRLLIVEDAAQAFGAKYKNQCAGILVNLEQLVFIQRKCLVVSAMAVLS